MYYQQDVAAPYSICGGRIQLFAFYRSSGRMLVNRFGLNPEGASDGNEKTVDKRGNYTNPEMYLNGLVYDIMQTGTE